MSRRPSIDINFNDPNDKENSTLHSPPNDKQRSALKRESQRMFSEKKVTERRIGTTKSIKSLKNIQFKQQQQVFIIPPSREQDSNFKQCCLIM